MSCCEWEVFEGGVRAAFQHAGIDEILIDWREAREAWDRHHATGGEYARVAIGKLKSEGDYLFALPR